MDIHELTSLPILKSDGILVTITPKGGETMYNPSYILTQPVPSEQIYSNTQLEIIRDYILEFQQNPTKPHRTIGFTVNQAEQ